MSESNGNSFGADAGNGPTGGNSGPEPVRHGWHCCCPWCLQGQS